VKLLLLLLCTTAETTATHHLVRSSPSHHQELHCKAAQLLGLTAQQQQQQQLLSMAAAAAACTQSSAQGATVAQLGGWHPRTVASYRRSWNNIGAHAQHSSIAVAVAVVSIYLSTDTQKDTKSERERERKERGEKRDEAPICFVFALRESWRSGTQLINCALLVEASRFACMHCTSRIIRILRRLEHTLRGCVLACALRMQLHVVCVIACFN
jgi:hypothetical protein